MTTIITAENIGKKYIIGHQSNERYSTIRDVIANKFKGLLNSSKKSIEHEEFWALKNINFEIKQGDRVGIIGRNGAGKSTLLKVLSRITEPTEGRVKVKGRVASLLEVGTGFHPELTGRENIFLNGAILGMSKNEIKRKFDEIVAFSEIERFLDTPVKRYSSGMYVRLAFAVAAHLEPEILVVDEVLAVGDAQFQQKCLGKMEEVGKEGRTVLFVSHNLSSIKALCDEAILLHKGNIKYKGDVTEAFDRYSNILNSKTNVDIKNIKRSSDCTLNAKIVDFRLMSEGKVNPENIDSTKPIKIKVKIEAKEDLIKENIGIMLYLRDTCQILTHFSSSHWHFPLVLKKGENILSCEIASPMLSQGRYYLDCLLYYTCLPRIFLDKVNDIYSFSVTEFDPYGTGLPIGELKFYVPHSWKIVCGE